MGNTEHSNCRCPCGKGNVHIVEFDPETFGAKASWGITLECEECKKVWITHEKRRTLVNRQTREKFLLK